MASLGELFIELGVVGDTQQVKEFDKKVKELAKDMDLTLKSSVKTNEGLNSLAKGIGIFVGAVTAAAVAVNKFTNDLVSSNQEMLNLTRTTDTALSTFQKWNGIGKMLGVENAAQQLESLNERLFELQLTGEGARGFQLAGINPLGQDAEGVLEQLRGRVAGLSDTAATYLLKQMGLDPRMLHLLRMSRSEFEALGETVRKYQLTDDQRSEIQALNVQLQITAQKLQYLKDRAVLAIMPAWKNLSKQLVDILELWQKIGQSISNFIKQSQIAQTAIRGIATAITILMATINPLIAALAALYLIIEDIAVYAMGGDSLTGDAIKALEGLKDKIKDVFKSEGIFGVAEIAIKKISCDLLEIAKVIVKAPNNIANRALYESLNYLKNNPDIYNKMSKEDKENLEKALKYHADKAGIVTSYDTNLSDINTIATLPVRNTSDNRVSYTYDQRQINMTNSIQTNQPAYNIENELLFARNAIGSAFA